MFTWWCSGLLVETRFPIFMWGYMKTVTNSLGSPNADQLIGIGEEVI